jgi:hypothetical protein
MAGIASNMAAIIARKYFFIMLKVYRLCLARRNCNKIEFFLNLGANIRKSGIYLLYLPQVYD